MFSLQPSFLASVLASFLAELERKHLWDSSCWRTRSLGFLVEDNDRCFVLSRRRFEYQRVIDGEQPETKPTASRMKTATTELEFLIPFKMKQVKTA